MVNRQDRKRKNIKGLIDALPFLASLVTLVVQMPCPWFDFVKETT